MILHPHVVRRAPAEPPKRDSLIVVEVEPPDEPLEDFALVEDSPADLDPPTEREPAPLALIPQSSATISKVTIAPVVPAGPQFGRARSRMGSVDGIPQNLIVDLISYVFGKSQLHKLVGADALRMVLSDDQHALFPEPGALELQVVWDLLEAQPGFVADHAFAPFCRLKLLETRLGLDVLLPAALGTLDAAGCRNRAADCDLRVSEVERILCPNKTVPITRVIEVIHVTDEPAPEKPRRLELAIVLALIGLGAAGFSAYRTFGDSGGTSGDELETVEVAQVSSEIPLYRVHRNGAMLMATLSDPTWALLPKSDKLPQLESAADHMRSLGASSLIVAEPDGTTRAVIGIDAAGTPDIKLIPRL